VGQVAITIRGKSYQIACDDGQEAHLARLGRYLDQRAEQIVTGSSRTNLGDALLAVMVALVVADELSDATAELENAKSEGVKAARAAAENEVVAAITAVAERIDRIAARLEGP
jgi:cell division protein ZapA